MKSTHMKNFDSFTFEYDSINEGWEQWIPKIFKNKTWRKIIGLKEIQFTQRALTQIERTKLLNSLSHLNMANDEKFLSDLIDSAFLNGDKLVILTRRGNKIKLELNLSFLEMQAQNKLTPQQLEKVIKILPEKFPNGELCAARFRKALSGGKTPKFPVLKVSQGLKFAPTEDIKIVRQIGNVLKHWDQSTWTEVEVARGYKEFTEVLNIALGLETGLKSVNTGKKQFALDYFANEFKIGNITKQELETFTKEVERYKDWEFQTVELPNSLRYSPREILFRIWDKQKYMKAYPQYLDATGDYTARGNADKFTINGKTSAIINWLPENFSEKPTKELLRNLFYHEIGHAKDVTLKLKVPTHYKPDPHFVDEFGKGFYKFFHRGKEKIKEWDFYLNYFVHRVENKVITRAALEDMKTNANRWLKSRYQAYREVGWDDLNSRKGSFQDTIEWFKSIKGFLRRADFYMNHTQPETYTQKELIEVRNFWELTSQFEVDSLTLSWLKECKNRNPEEFKIYAKKLVTQIDEWIEKLNPEAFESLKVY